jgi:ketosteroid isomerase-like protein
MSEENVEVVRAIFEEWARGNFSASQALLADDVVVSWEEPPTGNVVCHGREEVAQRFRAFLEQWEDFRAKSEEFIPLDDENVLVVARQRGTGKQSGVEIDSLAHIVWTLRDGNIAGVHWYFERDKALEAAGLPE